jgi:hypothetical protein
MVASADGAEPERKVMKPFNLHKREFVYTLPSGEVITVSPHKKGRGMVTVPRGTVVKVVKIDASTFFPHND